MKPVALYFRILKYRPENLHLLHANFNVIDLEHPEEIDKIDSTTIQLLFAPLGFMVDANYMDKLPCLKVIASNTTGIPHIDKTEAEKRGIKVCALHDEQIFLDTITPTAEHTIGLIMAANRRIPACHSYVLSGKWDRKPWGAPRMLSKMKLGIVGYGRLGKKTSEVGRALGMSVNYYDPYVDGGSSSLHHLAMNSDVLSIHAVANQETRNLVSREILELLPKNAIVVNTARGELLDTNALLDLLENQHLWAAALDTIDGEYALNFEAELQNSRLLKYAKEHDNLILTPHIGGSTVDAWTATERRVIDKALALFL
jgi:D-3-phosphoglycerate dehydrogenase